MPQHCNITFEQPCSLQEIVLVWLAKANSTPKWSPWTRELKPPTTVSTWSSTRILFGCIP